MNELLEKIDELYEKKYAIDREILELEHEFLTERGWTITPDGYDDSLIFLYEKGDFLTLDIDYAIEEELEGE